MKNGSKDGGLRTQFQSASFTLCYCTTLVELFYPELTAAELLIVRGNFFSQYSLVWLAPESPARLHQTLPLYTSFIVVALEETPMSQAAVSAAPAVNATNPNPERDWQQEFRPRFQTISSASLCWHLLMMEAIAAPHDAPRPTRVGDWNMDPGVSHEELFAEVSKALPKSFKLVAERLPGRVTAHDKKKDNSRYWHYGWTGPAGAVVCRGSIGNALEMDCTVRDQAIVEALAEIACRLDDAKQVAETAGMDYLAAGPQGMQIVRQASLGTELVRDNYTPEHLAFYDRVVSELPEGKKGRLAILTGPPGSGKTSLVEGWLTDLASTCRVVYVPSAMVAMVGRPELMTLLIAHHQKHKQPIVLVLEDADDILVHRAQDNMSGISTLLNITDGIQSKQADIRVIATANTSAEDLDFAAGRQGRFFGHLLVAKREPAHAREIFARLHPNDEYPFGNDKVHLGELYMGQRDAKLGKPSAGFSR